ncbi:MAG: glycosyltransferase family 2 protein [Oscillospiraceae bacterium]|nr:glycosyltransferase family 2 protein [Oscillospiraceae bacterium]
MTISVIIPVYNVEQYLSRCLESVLRNHTSDCEVLLIDDGATDGSGKICDEYAGRYPNLIRVIHQENGGLGAARNTGIEAATGEWLLFLDSDDTIAPETLSVLQEAAKTPGVQIVGFQYCTDDGAGKLTPGEDNFPPTNHPFTLADRPEFLLSPPSAAFRLWHRALFMESGIRFPARVWYEDIRTTVKLFCLASGIIVLPDPLYRYLQRPGSIMSNQNLDRNREIMDAFDDILSWFYEQSASETYQSELCALTVEHVLLAASVRVARLDPRHKLLPEFRAYLDNAFPDWTDNSYLRQLPRLKSLALRLVRGRHYRLLSTLFRLKG